MMRAYGVRRGDTGCCPGHDKLPSAGEKYNSKRSARERARLIQRGHKMARAKSKAELKNELVTALREGL